MPAAILSGEQPYSPHFPPPNLPLTPALFKRFFLPATRRSSRRQIDVRRLTGSPIERLFYGASLNTVPC